MTVTYDRIANKKIKWKKVFSTTFSSFNTPSETVYTIGLLPLGGYVKMKGILDESMDSDFKGADDELESKNALQKIWVMSAGVIMNLILTFFVFVLIFWACMLCVHLKYRILSP